MTAIGRKMRTSVLTVTLSAAIGVFAGQSFAQQADPIAVQAQKSERLRILSDDSGNNGAANAGQRPKRLALPSRRETTDSGHRDRITWPCPKIYSFVS